MKEQIKVYSAALFGFSSSTAGHFFAAAEPFLNFLLLLGQVGVAAITIVYIYRKWRNARKK